jgi:hypothetical protein
MDYTHEDATDAIILYALEKAGRPLNNSQLAMVINAMTYEERLDAICRFQELRPSEDEFLNMPDQPFPPE